MARFARMIVNLAVATGVATALLISPVLQARSSGAGSPDPQDVAKVQTKEVTIQKAEIKVEFTDKVIEVKGKAVEAAGKAVAAPKPAIKIVAQPAQIGIMVAAPVNADAMTTQMIQQYRPIFRAELLFLTSVCKPNPDQRRAIALEGGRAVKEVAKNVAEIQMGINQIARRNNQFPDPRKVIRDAMANAAKEKLSPEQFAIYQKELDSRIEDQRKVVMLNLVANMDKLLVLSRDQRDKLCESILSHWDDKTFPTVETQAMYDAYFPIIPDQYISPVLTDAQHKTWQGAQKLNFSSIRNFNFFNGNMAPEPAEGDDPDEKAAFAEEEKK